MEWPRNEEIILQRGSRNMQQGRTLWSIIQPGVQNQYRISNSGDRKSLLSEGTTVKDHIDEMMIEGEQALARLVAECSEDMTCSLWWVCPKTISFLRAQEGQRS